jgi:hypothetical protein
MKNMKNLIYALSLLALAVGCTEEEEILGYNHTYAQGYDDGISELIDIRGFVADTVYTLDQYDTLYIDPALHLGPEITDVEYEWKINYETVSTDPILSAEVRVAPILNTAPYAASLCITDKATGLKYYKNFKLFVTTSITNGIFFLSERADETARLSFQRRDRPGVQPLVHDLFESANPTFGTLGKRPKQVVYGGENVDAELRTIKLLCVVCDDEERLISELDPGTLTLNSYVTRASILGGYTGECHPVSLTLYGAGMLVGSGGQFFAYGLRLNQSLYRPSPLVDGDYELAEWATANQIVDTYNWISYDNKAQTFVTLEIDGNPLLYERIVPMPVNSNVSTAGQRFLAGGVGAEYRERYAILYNEAERKAYFYYIDVYYTIDYTTWDIIPDQFVALRSTQEDLVDMNTYCFFDGEYWYFGNNNEVTRVHNMGGTPLPWFTAPKGNVVTMATDRDMYKINPYDRIPPRRLFVATYDGSKSYIYVININTKEVLEEETIEIEGKIVSLCPKGTWV